MKWADFEAERDAIRQNVERVQSACKNVTYPRGSSQDQAGAIARQQTALKGKQRTLTEEISAAMEKPEEPRQAELPWDMPVLPQAARKIQAEHNEALSEFNEKRESFLAVHGQRKIALRSQWRDDLL